MASPQCSQLQEQADALVNRLRQGGIGGDASEASGRVWIDANCFYVEGRDGKDFTAVCATHQWASGTFYSVLDRPVCPFCACDLDHGRGRERYRQLSAA